MCVCVCVCTKKIVIERTRGLIYLKFVATDFFLLAKTTVTQRSPCYSAVSALLMNPLLDRSNYSPLLPHLLPHSRINSLVSLGQTLYQAAPLETNISLLQCFTAESSWELRRKLNNKQKQVSMFLILLFKLLTQFPFVSFLSISILFIEFSRSDPAM